VEVEVAGNGREAIEILAREGARFDIVLMDIQMPEMDGYEATRRIRLDPRFVNLPIIAMTAHALVEERQKVLEVGMNDHIAKPIDPDVMFETLRRYFSRGHSPTPSRACLETPSEQVPVPEIEGLDVKAGIRRVAGNSKLYCDLLRRFVEGQRDAAERVREALRAGDAATAERIAHTAKGVSGNLGASEVQAVAGELERSIGGGEAAAVREQILERFARAMQGTIARVVSALEAAQAAKPQATKPQAPSGEEADADAVGRMLDKLVEYAEANDSEAGDYLASVRETLARCCPQQEFEKLESSLRSYDFAAAVEVLRVLRRAVLGSSEGSTAGPSDP
jgi:CheY-like chemotaxis protein